MISEHVSLAAAALKQVDDPTRERIRATAIAEVTRVRGGRQGPGAGRGTLHRRNEIGSQFARAPQVPGRAQEFSASAQRAEPFGLAEGRCLNSRSCLGSSPGLLDTRDAPAWGFEHSPITSAALIGEPQEPEFGTSSTYSIGTSTEEDRGLRIPTSRCMEA